MQKINDYQWTVYTTWAVSFERLTPPATKFLRLCSFLHHDGISETNFQKAATNSGNFDPPVPLSDQELDLRMAQDFLSMFQTTDHVWDIQKFLNIVIEIGSYSHIDSDNQNCTYSIHPLVHTWMQTIDSHGCATGVCAQWVLAIPVDWESKTEDYGFRKMLLPHIDMSLSVGGGNCCYCGSSLATCI